MFKKSIATAVLSIGLVAGSASVASAVPTVPGTDGPPNRHPGETWTDIHTGVAVYQCDVIHRGKYNKKGHKIPKWKRTKYVNCHVVYL